MLQCSPVVCELSDGVIWRGHQEKETLEACVSIESLAKFHLFDRISK